MTRDQLQTCTKKQLIELARQRGVLGWHGMRKEELVEALAGVAAARSSSHKRVKDHIRKVIDYLEGRSRGL